MLTKTSNSSLTDSQIDLDLVIHDPNVIVYLQQFEDEEEKREKTLEAIKVGVIAIQSASPTLDTRVVQQKFSEIERAMKTQVGDFQEQVKQVLRSYFEDKKGVVPRSIEDVFGSDGSLTQTFVKFFDPADGRLCRLMQSQIGPDSEFGKVIDPQNKKGIVSLIEAKVKEQVEAKLDDVLQQFSLDESDSAMSRLNKMLSDYFVRLNQSLGIQEGAESESQRGHVKGLDFERDVYQVFADMGRQLGDETEFVGGTAGSNSRCKKGDFVSSLGDSSGAPGANICVEVKDTPMKLKAAIDELQAAKANRESTVGIMIFSRGTEPSEVGDFRKIGEDFFVTVDKDAVANEEPLMFFDTAYRIARALVVATERKNSAGELDIQKIEEHVDALLSWIDRIVDMSKKARTIQSSGKLIEECAVDLKADMDVRLTEIMNLLAQGN